MNKGYDIAVDKLWRLKREYREGLLTAEDTKERMLNIIFSLSDDDFEEIIDSIFALIEVYKKVN